MSTPTPSPELVADVDEVFIGYWDDDVMAIVREPYTPGALRAFAWIDGGAHIPAETAGGTS
ncbi:hypothetical protein ACIQXA_08680 [Streptomyces massasporeus]|uniref:hypothetical protein n=1 Tax=Streptomyces massasporeus TaxID=67324 RepID=UPI003809EC91